ncbi:MAG: TlpA disulfide reductase family protein [Burkholderiaceae bacterium]
MKKSQLALLVVVGALCAGAGMYFSASRFAPVAAQPAAVSSLYGQTLPDAGGAPQPLSQWRGKNLVVNFWATWCAPCVEEMPELTDLQTELQGKNIQIIGIGIDSATNIAEFSSKLKIGYPVYVAGMGGSDLSRLFGNQAGGLPFTVIVGADGHIRKTYLGRLKIDELRRDLAML